MNNVSEKLLTKTLNTLNRNEEFFFLILNKLTIILDFTAVRHDKISCVCVRARYSG